MWTAAGRREQAVETVVRRKVLSAAGRREQAIGAIVGRRVGYCGEKRALGAAAGRRELLFCLSFCCIFSHSFSSISFSESAIFSSLAQGRCFFGADGVAKVGSI